MTWERGGTAGSLSSRDSIATKSDLIGKRMAKNRKRRKRGGVEQQMNRSQTSFDRDTFNLGSLTQSRDIIGPPIYGDTRPLLQQITKDGQRQNPLFIQLVNQTLHPPTIILFLSSMNAIVYCVQWPVAGSVPALCRRPFGATAHLILRAPYDGGGRRQAVRLVH